MKTYRAYTRAKCQWADCSQAFSDQWHSIIASAKLLLVCSDKPIQTVAGKTAQ